MTPPDVVIAGAGPAGSIAARELARKGVAVVLIERTPFPRRKVCGEYLNCGSLALLEELGLARDLQSRFQPLRGLYLNAGGAMIELTFPAPAAGLDRAALDAELLRAACDAGAVHLTGRVTGLQFTGDRVCAVEYEAGGEPHVLSTRFVIGADGCGSLVARKLGWTRALPATARYAMGGHFAAQPADMLTMNVDRGSYLAINPLRGDLENVMLVTPREHIRAAAQRPDEWFAAESRRLHYRDISYTANSRIGKRVTVGPLSHHVARSAGNGVLLAGDAAGFVSPFTGQGVYLAILSARAAARTVIDALATPAREAEMFAGYDRRQRHERRMRAALSTILDQLAYMPPLARRVMRRVTQRDATREQLLRLFCGLTPPSFVLGARLLVPLAL